MIIHELNDFSDFREVHEKVRVMDKREALGGTLGPIGDGSKRLVKNYKEPENLPHLEVPLSCVRL
jgi:hypothetical protein